MINTKKMATKPQMASTVILIREYDGELQVYLLKRSTRSGFFPGTYVFPGGRVETEDQASGLWKVHVDLDSQEISQRFGGSLTEEEALTYGVTAIRDSFEPTNPGYTARAFTLFRYERFEKRSSSTYMGRITITPYVQLAQGKINT